MDLTSLQLRQLVKSLPAVLIMNAQHGNGDQNLICMESWIMPVQNAYFGLLDRLYHFFRNELDFMRYAGKMLGGIDYKCRARSQQ